jgi:ADP-ribose pyrophosphatase
MPRALSEKFLSKKKIFSGRAINFHVDTVRLPNGKKATREFVDHPGAAAVVPLTADGCVILVRQHRHPVGRITYELPAGKLDQGESPRTCVRRELREETGYTAKRYRPLLTFWPAPAFSNERLHIFVAEGLTAGSPSPDEDEFVETARIPFKTALRWVHSGKIQDAKTVIGLLACANGKAPTRKSPAKRRRR